MKYVLMLTALMTIGCKIDTGDKDKKNDDITGIQDIWEYYNADGNCTGAELYGDSANGCLRYFQLTRFNDGTYFFSCNMGNGPTLGWSWTEYVTDDDLDAEFNLGGGLRFKLEGDLSKATPEVTIYFDSDGDYADTASLDVDLEEL